MLLGLFGVIVTLSKPMIFSEPEEVWIAASCMVVLALPSLAKFKVTFCHSSLLSKFCDFTVAPASVIMLMIASPPDPLFHRSASRVYSPSGRRISCDSVREGVPQF